MMMNGAAIILRVIVDIRQELAGFVYYHENYRVFAVLFENCGLDSGL